MNALRNAMRANRWLVTLVGPAAELGRWHQCVLTDWWPQVLDMNELGAQTGAMLEAIKECSTLVRMTCWAGARTLAC